MSAADKKRQRKDKLNYRDREYPVPDDGGTHNPNLNAICLNCRFSRRVSQTHMHYRCGPICPYCRQKMYNLFCIYRIPRKTNDRGWVILERLCKAGMV